MLGLIFAAAVGLSPPCMRVPPPTQHRHVAHKVHRKPLCAPPTTFSAPLIGPAPTFITVPAEPEIEPLNVVTYFVPAPAPTSNNTPPPEDLILWEPIWEPFMPGGGGFIGTPASVQPVAVAPLPRKPLYPNPPEPSTTVAVNRAPELDISSAMAAVTALAIGIALFREKTAPCG